MHAIHLTILQVKFGFISAKIWDKKANSTSQIEIRYIANVFILPKSGEGSRLIQSVSDNIPMLLLLLKSQKTSVWLNVM